MSMWAGVMLPVLLLLLWMCGQREAWCECMTLIPAFYLCGIGGKVSALMAVMAGRSVEEDDVQCQGVSK